MGTKQSPDLLGPRPPLAPLTAVPVAPVASQRRRVNPLIPVCCLGLILLLIAATIVLSLIPVYLESRNTQRPTVQSAQFTLFPVLRNGFLPIGPLRADNCLRIQNELRRRALSNRNFRTSVPTVLSCRVSGNSTSGGRKKRQITAQGNQIDILVILSPGNCLNNRCILARARAFINLLIDLGDFLLTLILSDGSSFDFVAFVAGSSPVTLVPTPPIDSGTTSTAGTPTVLNQNFYAVTSDNRLVLYNTQNLNTILSNLSIVGVTAGDSITNIDFRPATGQLYGTSNSRLYIINEDTGVARVLGNALPSQINGDITSIEFQPAFDIARIITSGGDFLVVDPEDGEILARNTTAIFGGGTSVAYSNNLAGASTSTLFIIDPATDALFSQTLPDSVAVVQVGSGLGVNITEGIGFDISPTGIALAADVVNGAIVLYVVDVNSGIFSQTLGVITEPIVSLAIPTALVAYAIQADSQNLLIGNALTTNLNLAFVSKPITGLQPGEVLLGIDMRPLNGQLFALGSTSRLYSFDLGSGDALLIGSGPFSPPLDGTSFGFDFNPTVDRIRVVSNLGQNLRLNPDTGEVAGVDTPINPNSSNVTAVAYTNNFANALSTVLFDIDSVSDRLRIQVSPNNGTLVDVGPLGIDVGDNNGFDISSKSGIALALVTVNGANAVYRIDLNTGAATLIPGTVTPPAIRGFSLGLNI